MRYALELGGAFVAGGAGFAFLAARRRRRLSRPPVWPTPLSPPLSHVTRRPRGAA